MFYACATKFDVTVNLKNFLVFRVRLCLVHPENQKVSKILRHIESYDTCMKH